MTDTTKKDDGDTKMVEAVMNAKLPCGQYVFEAVDKAEVRAIIAAAKPMIERDMLCDAFNYGDVTGWATQFTYNDMQTFQKMLKAFAKSRGIGLEAKSVADSVSRRAPTEGAEAADEMAEAMARVGIRSDNTNDTLSLSDDQGADSVSRRADLNSEPSGEPLQNGLQPLSEVARLRELLGGFVKNRAHITAGELDGVLDRLMDMSAAALKDETNG